MRASDLYLTQARTASAKSNLTVTKSQLARAKNLMYRYSLIDVDNELADVEAPKDLPKGFEGAWEQVLEHNPIIKAKHHEIKTSDYIRRKELLGLYPSVSVDLAASKTFDTAGVQGIEEDLSAMLNMKYEFNFGGRFYKAAASKSRAQLRRSEYQKSRADIYNNLSSLYTDYQEINDRIIFLKGNRDYLEEVIKKHKKEFQAGFRSLFDLLNTKNEFFNADIQYVNAIYDRKILAYTILANTGKLLMYFNKENG
jgi:adhesin transport system outer membrane protein